MIPSLSAYKACYFNSVLDFSISNSLTLIYISKLLLYCTNCILHSLACYLSLSNSNSYLIVNSTTSIRPLILEEKNSV